MSGFAAIIRFDGGGVAPGEIERMTAAMAYRGVDGIAHWTDGAAALGHCMLRTTAESLEEVQPLANEDESLVLVMDGWLSNWEELRADLLARGARLRTRSDAELVLRAYEVWGEDSPQHIDGEFAFLIWDKRRREAFCARDHAGLRPLHYHSDGKRLVVASDIGGVMAGPGVEERRNLGMIGEYLANQWFTPDETVWQGVLRLKQAHWMRFGRGGRQGGKYWTPPLEVSIRYKRDEDYFAHYREVFADSVRRSSRTHLPLSCDVSGGLDSSAVFCMAHELLQQGSLPAPSIEGYTYHFEDRIEIDDLEYARAVADHLGVTVHEVPPFLPGIGWFAERGREYRDVAGYPNGAMGIAIGERLVGDGCRVNLNGEGGDEWLAGKPYHYHEQLSGRDWRALGTSLRGDAADIGLRRTAANFAQFGLAPYLPKRLKTFARRLFNTGPSRFAAAYWLSPGLRGELAARRAAMAQGDSFRIPNMARRAMHAVLTYVFIGIVRDHIARQSARIGYEVRSPMYSRNFMEFAFALPERIKLRGDTRKYIHIRALEGLIPEVVARRTTKADFLVAFTRHFDLLRNQIVDEIPTALPDLLDGDSVARLYDADLQGPYDARPVWELWGVLAIGSLLHNK